MERRAEEMMLRAQVKDRGRASADEEGTRRWARGERTQAEAEGGDWGPADAEAGERQRTDAPQARECDGSSSALFSLRRYLSRSSSTDSLSSSPQSNTAVDCAGIVLSCLFCRLHDLIHMLPDSCERAVNNCCPSYKQVATTTESGASSDDDSCVDFDCGLFSACNEGGDCLELAMEVSEMCYH